MAADLNVRRSTYNQATATTKQRMDEAIHMLSPSDVPLTMLLGSENTPNTKYEWLNDELGVNFVTPDATSATASTTISVSADDSTRIRPGDILQNRGGTVQALVTAVNYTNGDLTVIRPWAGSTDESVGASNTLDVVGQAMVEGADPQDPRGTNPSTDYNYTQIFQEQITATRTARSHEQWAISDPYAYDLEKRYKELAIKREYSNIYGLRNRDTTTSRRSYGGMLYYMTQNAKSGVLNDLETKLNDALQATWEQGSEPPVLMCSPAFIRQFSLLNADRVLEDRGDTGVGRRKVSYMSDFGEVRILVNRWLTGTKKNIIFDPQYVTQVVYDGWFHEPLAKTGDSDKGQVVGEFGFKVKCPKAHSVLTITDLA